MKCLRRILEEQEEKVLVPYAQLSSKSLGREYPEEECPFRTCFYRDVGRIIHSMSFRLLEYKTQVFMNSEGDYYRTRLTHTLEVAQMSIGLARILGVNQDLSHAIALAHDLGHPPFGHAGEEVLDELMRDEGGFEHNLQSYRVVTYLEERYPNFHGLNLSYEVLEGIRTHTTEYDNPKDDPNFKSRGFPTIEAQIVNCADEIAYINHDLDDGIHWGMLDTDMLLKLELWREVWDRVEEGMPFATERIKRIRTISELIGLLIDDLQRETRRRIEELGIKSLQDVRERGEGLVSFSSETKRKMGEVKNFLLANVYHHPDVRRKMREGQEIIRALFEAYVKDPKLLPDKYRERLERDGSKRNIADYIAGMTDRFAIAKYRELAKGGKGS
jgi:dGTPase